MDLAKALAMALSGLDVSISEESGRAPGESHCSSCFASWECCNYFMSPFFFFLKTGKFILS
jgi:hypothetical protein